MKDNILIDKSIAFAARIIKLNQHRKVRGIKLPTR